MRFAAHVVQGLGLLVALALAARVIAMLFGMSISSDMGGTMFLVFIVAAFMIIVSSIVLEEM